MPHRITLIPGVGTGSGVMEAAVCIPEATDVRFGRGVTEAGIGATEKYRSVLPWPGVREGRPAIGQVSDRVSRRSNTSCAETRSRERQ